MHGPMNIKSVCEYLQPFYKGHVMGYVSHVYGIYGDCYISDFLTFYRIHKWYNKCVVAIISTVVNVCVH
jgi:hypothetical protein